MICSHPMAFLNDEKLFDAALDYEQLPEEARKHIEQCDICQQELARYQIINSHLQSVLYRYQCPTTMQLSIYSARCLPEEERLAVEAHLRICPRCAAEVEETLHFLAKVEKP